MVLIARAGSERRHSTINGRYGLCEMASNENAIRSSTSPVAEASPPQSVSPSAQHSSLSWAKGLKMEWEERAQGELHEVPKFNGPGVVSPPWKREEMDGGNKCAEDDKFFREISSPQSLGKSGMVKVEDVGGEREEVQHGNTQDGPLDFSLKRRDSVSESFTDDSRASSSISPPIGPHISSSSTSFRHSPEERSPRQRAPEGLSHEQDRSVGGRSPMSSPDIGEGAGQTKLDGKREELRSPSKSSLAGLGLTSDTPAGGVTPAALAAILGQNGKMIGSLSTLSTMMNEARKVQAGANGGKVQRPFKAYPREALHMPLGYLGLPGVSPFLGIDQSFLQGLAVNQEDLVTIYRQQRELLKERETLITNAAASKGNSRSPPSVTPTSSSKPANGSSSAIHPAPTSSTSRDSPQLSSSPASGDLSPHTLGQAPSTPPQPDSPPPVSLTSSSPTSFPAPSAPPLVSSTNGSSGSGNRKRPRTCPDSDKDDAYWERRRKNNDAAKRSRDARRAKEDEIAIRAALLEQENLKLRVEVAALKSETARLRCMLYNT